MALCAHITPSVHDSRRERELVVVNQCVDGVSVASSALGGLNGVFLWFSVFGGGVGSLCVYGGICVGGGHGGFWVMGVGGGMLVYMV